MLKGLISGIILLCVVNIYSSQIMDTNPNMIDITKPIIIRHLEGEYAGYYEIEPEGLPPHRNTSNKYNTIYTQNETIRAIPNDGIDDSKALQAAMDYFDYSIGMYGTIYIPTGHYIVDKQVDLACPYLRIYGEGNLWVGGNLDPSESILNIGIENRSSAFRDFEISGLRFINCSNIIHPGTPSASHTNNLIRISSYHQGRISNCTFIGGDTAIVFTPNTIDDATARSSRITVTECTFDTMNVAIGSPSFPGSQAIPFSDWNSFTIADLSIQGNRFQGCQQSNVALTTIDGIDISDNYFFPANTYNIYLQTVTKALVSNNMIFSEYSVYGIFFQNPKFFSITNNYIYNPNWIGIEIRNYNYEEGCVGAGEINNPIWGNISNNQIVKAKHRGIHLRNVNLGTIHNNMITIDKDSNDDFTIFIENNTTPCAWETLNLQILDNITPGEYTVYNLGVDRDEIEFRQSSNLGLGIKRIDE